MTDTETTLPATLEAILFFKGGSVTVKELARIATVTPDEVRTALTELKEVLVGRGVRLVLDNDEAELATSPDVAPLIESLRREELEGPLGKAGLETLAVIMYQGPVARADIEYIRGVNVSSTLRTLLIRGLIERVDNPKDKRSFMYRATTELPAYLGVSSIADLPEYASVRDEVQKVYAERPAAEPTEE
jgi:segregation and condensation protein B